ncbi:MAG TPA: hypothetical protein VGP89_18075 [Candidatus Angelobacter sp.]|jgi:hypothetical protein|nr:hypothetical protein [Candidatus Angelobacter sp.]
MTPTENDDLGFVPDQTTAASKSITKKQIHALADKHGVKHAEAEKQFADKGYTINP